MEHQALGSREEYLKNLEHYRALKKDAWQSMSLEEKIDFFDGIHTDRVPMFDENGNDTLWTIWNYGEICNEFIQRPEMFSISDISKFMEMLDDDCYQPSFMDDTLKVIRSIVRFYEKDGAIYFLSHLSDIPEQGKEYGLCDGLWYLIVDDITFSYLKEAIAVVDSSIRNLLFQILHGEISGASLWEFAEDIEQERLCELEALLKDSIYNKENVESRKGI